VFFVVEIKDGNDHCQPEELKGVIEEKDKALEEQLKAPEEKDKLIAVLLKEQNKQ
jgi:hypothetical protein